MKQTAIEWLVEQIENYSDTIFYDRNLHWFEKYVEQAKEMEKEQIIDAYDRGYDEYDIYRNGQNYYNETFK